MLCAQQMTSTANAIQNKDFPIHSKFIIDSVLITIESCNTDTLLNMIIFHWVLHHAFTRENGPQLIGFPLWMCPSFITLTSCTELSTTGGVICSEELPEAVQRMNGTSTALIPVGAMSALSKQIKNCSGLSVWQATHMQRTVQGTSPVCTNNAVQVLVVQVQKMRPMRLYVSTMQRFTVVLQCCYRT